MWVVQAEATFGVHECLDIVHGILPAINVALRNRINDWNHRHARAREALLKRLEPAEMINIYGVRENAIAIWKRLYEEYGQVLERTFNFTVFAKSKETSRPILDEIVVLPPPALKVFATRLQMHYGGQTANFGNKHSTTNFEHYLSNGLSY
jgi:hypothetical protein